MQSLRLLLVTAVVVAWASQGVHARLADIINDRPPIIQVIWENALLPCTCTHQVFNCSDRGMQYIEAESVCSNSFAAVDLSHNQLNTFPNGMNGATVVNASSNRLTTLPAIEKLNPRITFLDVSNNRIENVTESYQNFQSLQELRLTSNKGISSLSFLPRPCALRILLAGSLQLSTLDENVRECRQLEVLDISDNSLTSLPSDAFSNLTRLHELHLSYNSIKSLSSQQFASLTHLRILRLRNLGLESLPSHIFDSLSHLEQLNLAKNELKSLQMGIFSGLSRLILLNLETNRFETLPTQAFQDLHALEELRMGNNQLTTLPDGALLSLPNIKEAHFMLNEIVSVGTNLCSNATQLEALTLDHNPLTTLPRGLFSHLPYLRFVFFTCSNDVDMLLELSHVENIYFSGCGEVHWRSGAFSALSSVVRLVINDHEVLSVANESLQGLSNLKVLDISQNGLTSLPASFFSYTPNITGIVLFGNNLTTLPENIFSGLVNLIDINIEHNFFVNLPENLFQGATSLERINLNYNQLSSIPQGLFSNIPSLFAVSLERNKLTTLPSFESTWPPLQKVSLSLNGLREVPTAALRSWLSASAVPRYVTIVEEVGHGVDPSALGWLLQEPGVLLGRGSDLNCRCGCVRRGMTLMYVCVNATCPSMPEGVAASWVDTLRDASRSNNRNEIESH